MLAITEKKWGIKYIQMLPVPTESNEDNGDNTENNGEQRFSLLRNLLNVKHHVL